MLHSLYFQIILHWVAIPRDRYFVCRWVSVPASPRPQHRFLSVLSAVPTSAITVGARGPSQPPVLWPVHTPGSAGAESKVTMAALTWGRDCLSHKLHFGGVFVFLVLFFVCLFVCLFILCPIAKPFLAEDTTVLLDTWQDRHSPEHSRKNHLCMWGSQLKWGAIWFFPREAEM